MHNLDDFGYDQIKYQGKNVLLISDCCQYRTIVHNNISDKTSDKVSWRLRTDDRKINKLSI